MLIGEAPGYYEEVQQEPFVGRAGEKLNQILKAMGLSRDTVSYTHLDVYKRQVIRHAIRLVIHLVAAVPQIQGARKIPVSYTHLPGRGAS